MKLIGKKHLRPFVVGAAMLVMVYTICDMGIRLACTNNQVVALERNQEAMTDAIIILQEYVLNNRGRLIEVGHRHAGGHDDAKDAHEMASAGSGRMKK